jgi:hypothetical protein
MAGFQTTSLGMLKTVGLVIASLAVSIDSLLADNAFAARGLMESVAKFANLLVAGIEATFNSAIIGVNLLNQAANFLPGVEIAPIPLLNFGRLSEDYGSVGAFERGKPGAAPGAVIPDRLDRMSAAASMPSFEAPAAIPAPVIPSTGGGSGGGAGSAILVPIERTFSTNFGISDEMLFGATASDGQRQLPDTVNITVNTVTADANLPTLIVEALQQYNLVNGPADFQIAI